MTFPNDAQALLLPVLPHHKPEGYAEADEECSTRVRAWIRERADWIRKAWSRPGETRDKLFPANQADLADDLCELLTRRAFNFQSRTRVDPILPGVRQNLVRQLATGAPLVFFFLYNGGYRASPFPNDPSLVFEPDQTEMMLLYQVALLNEKVSSLHGMDIEFFVVLNNGVASWVNDIPMDATEHYARQFRRMIESLGAAKTVRVLVQSELEGHDPSASFETLSAALPLSEKEHRLIERFLGRSCSREEARRRAALYPLAEARWAEDLSAIVAAKGGLMLRQVAHPDMLSFRPFPGGAIRIQNGSLGFEVRGQDLAPELVTTETVRQQGVHWVRCGFPWSAHGRVPDASVLADA